MYEVKLQQFQGPLDKLLELIETKKMEITEIGLAEVTGDFLNYLKELEKNIAPSLLADFLVVAAKLVLIKSKALLPVFELTNEEETEIQDLEAQLKIYREFKRASRHIQEAWEKNSQAFSRPLFLNFGTAPSFFYPPQNLKIDDLIKAVKNLLSSLRSLIPEAAKVVKEAVITIEMKIKELLARFQNSLEESFKKLAAGKSKKEVIVYFLAILHLLKDRLVNVEQNQQFGDIILRKQE